MTEDRPIFNEAMDTIASLRARIAKLEAENTRWVNDVNITEDALGISGLYATKDKQIDKLQAVCDRLAKELEAAREKLKPIEEIYKRYAAIGPSETDNPQENFGSLCALASDCWQAIEKAVEK